MRRHIYTYIYRLIHASLFIFVLSPHIFAWIHHHFNPTKKALMILRVTLEPSTQSRASSHAPTNIYIYIYRLIHASFFIVFHIIFSLGFIIISVLLKNVLMIPRATLRAIAQSRASSHVF